LVQQPAIEEAAPPPAPASSGATSGSVPAAPPPPQSKPAPPVGDLRRSARVRSRGCQSNQTKTFLLPGGYKLVQAHDACSFDISEALLATNVIDGLELADALFNSDDTVLAAQTAKVKEFRNEEGGLFESHSVPKNVAAAIRAADSGKWVESMHDELGAHIGVGTWILVPISSIPKGKKLVGSTWVFDLKRTSQGLIERYKARLCAQGFSQKEGEDFVYTFSNTVSYDTLRLVLAISALHDMELTSLDIKTAYLNGYVEDGMEIYMLPPRGFRFEPDGAAGKATYTGKALSDSRYACKLVRSIYGLKQSGRRWENRLVEELTRLGFIRCNVDPCLWKYTEGRNILLLTVYVDDLVMATNSKKLRETFVKSLKEMFQIRNEGPLTWVFGTAICQNLTSGTVSVDQTLYIEEVIRTFGTPDCKKTRVVPSIEDILLLQPIKDEHPVHEQYRALVGKLLWISIISRPDIAFAVSYLARFNAAGGAAHFAHLVRIVDYLAATRRKKIVYRREVKGKLSSHLDENCQESIGPIWHKLISFSDASHGGEKPMAGTCHFIAGGPVAWGAFRLRSTPISVSEGEYGAATKAAVTLIALNETLAFTGFASEAPSVIFCDNQAAVLLSESATSNKRLKHVATRIAFLRELVEARQLRLVHIKGSAQLADIFTKPLRADVYHPLRSFFLE
jgi:hypothetical protein